MPAAGADAPRSLYCAKEEALNDWRPLVMLHLVLSLDYELFGNGSGDVQSVIVEPTSRILETCDRHGVKISIMFEVAEYLALKGAWEDGLLPGSYSPAREMEEQILDAVGRGHDVQLHIHPQWLGAVLRDRVWCLNMEQYRIADLPNGYGTINDPLSILGAMSICKSALEQLVNKRRPEYRCRVFRAGGFLVQPSKLVVEAMVESGIAVDSSVVKGLVRSAPYEVDFRHAVSHRNWWKANVADVASRGSEGVGLVELPIYSYTAPYLWNFRPGKLRAALQRRELEKRDDHSRINATRSTPSSWEVFRKLFSSHAHTLDFCKLSAATMHKIVKREQATDPDGVLVLIGHSKDFRDERELDLFLGKVSQLEDVRVSTFDELVPLVTAR